MSALYSKQVLPFKNFIGRLGRSLGVAGAIIAASLFLGTVGYHALGHLNWIDSLLNAAMILTGMGPVDRMEGTSAKLFATFYALFSGVVFITTMGVVIAPVLHRMMHKFHLEEDK